MSGDFYEHDELLQSPFAGNLHKIDCESLNTLVHQYDQALEENSTKKSQFQKFKDDYIKLKTRLHSLPEKLEYDAMVPLCSRAICPGKIIHTNEIFCLLGENLFVECTAKKAFEIVSHRLKRIDDTLNRLEKERDLYNSWKIEAERQMVETLGDGTIEIVEEYDEEKEKVWKKEHREKVRRYHQELGKERQKKTASSAVNNVGKTEEEHKLWTRLDALELEEEFMEAQAIYEEKISETCHPKETSCTAKIREKSKPNLLEGLVQTDNRDDDWTDTSNASSGKKVTFSPENIVHTLADLTIKDSKKRSKETDVSNQPEEIELYKPSDICENGLYDPIFIRFRHELQSVNSPEEDDLVSSDSDSDTDEDYQIVLSPGDVYEQFGPPSLEAKSAAVPGADKAPLKSILKSRSQEEILIQDRSGSKLSHKELRISASVKKRIENTATAMAPKVTERVPNSLKSNVEVNAMSPCTVQQPSTDVINTNGEDTTAKSSKPISLFKRMKLGASLSADDASN